MIILSIDVGIKNLALCLFQYKPTNSNAIGDKIKIMEWQVINLCNDELPRCCAKDKKGVQCKNKSKYTKNNNYYCKKHLATNNLLAPSAEFKPSKLKKLKIGELKTLALEKSIEIEKSNKRDEIMQKLFKYVDENYASPIQKTNANYVNFVDIGIALRDSFDKLFDDTLKLDVILIENQISKLANRMKTLQGMITQYFIMKNQSSIKFFSSVNKLKYFIDKKRTSYSERKKQGISITNKLMPLFNIQETYVEIFKGSSKKDDLSDCFLQGIAYLIESHRLDIPDIIDIAE